MIFYNLEQINLELIKVNTDLFKKSNKLVVKYRKNERVPQVRLYFFSNWNNSHLVVSTLSGKTVFKLRSGCAGLIGSRRKTPYSGHRLGAIAGQKLKELGFSCIYVELKGFGKSRQGLLKGLRSISSININRIIDITSVKHNGCRKKKQRRL